MMPSDMRLQCPSEDTPPSTRPPSVASSAASTSGTPRRSTSMDSLHTNSSTSDKPCGEEFIPTRLIRAAPKANVNAMQFVKTGPAMLHKSAREQMKKAEVVKSLRKTSLQEEEEWQSSSSSNPRPPDEGSDWQTNLDKWKSNRRKRNEDVLERVIEVKKNEQGDEYTKTRRKSKTFSEMREEKTRRGRRYNLVVHDDDNNDLSDLGLSSAKNGSSLSDPPEEGEAKYADTKSDAGFCTGSDTGSDGVFAEDSISDTSSALGDKREIHDSLESGVSSVQKDVDVMINGHVNDTTTSLKTTTIDSEYTYDKAIEEYKQFAENSVKKRTSSVTSLSSNASGSKDDEKMTTAIAHRVTITRSSSSRKIDDKLSFFDGSSEKFEKAVAEPKFIRRERNSAKVDIDKRRSMFELRDIDHQEAKRISRRSMDVSTSLRNKVASFENISDSANKASGISAPRDTKFKEKLASFSMKEKGKLGISSHKKVPERDQNFYQKLQSFTQMETKTSPERRNSFECRGSASIFRTSPDRKYPPWKPTERKAPPIVFSPERRTPERLYGRKASPAPTPLKDRIASFENLSPLESSPSRRELSVSMESLNKTSSLEGSRALHSSQSVTNLFRRPPPPPPPTPFMVVEVDETIEEKTCVKRNVSRVSPSANSTINDTTQPSAIGKRSESVSVDGSKRLTVYEEIEKVEIHRDVSSAPIYSIFKGLDAEDYEIKPAKIENLETKESETISTRAETTFEASAKREVPQLTPPQMPESSPPRIPKLPSPAQEVPTSGTLPETDEISLSRTIPAAAAPPPHLPDVPPTRVQDTTVSRVPESSPKVPDSSLPRVPKEAPPPVPPPRVPTIEDPYTATHYESSSGSSLQTETRKEKEEEERRELEDIAKEPASDDLEYGDQDIDEVIDDYEHLSEAITIGDGGAYQEETSYTAILSSPEENLYEKISEDEPLYENIYEKVPDGSESSVDPEEGPQDHHYQTLDEANTQKANPSPVPQLSPTLPPKNKTLSVFEVLDVTWTEDISSSPAVPPSVPPPPPPPEEEGEELDEPTEGGGLSPPITPSSTPVENEGHSTKPALNSPQSTKYELRKKMSDFLGTKPHVEEELTLQPPPDASELLRQEREAERLIVQKQASLVRESSLSEFDFSGGSQALGRTKYTWEDRMKADGPKHHKVDLDESCDHLEFHTPVSSQSSSVHAYNTYQQYVSHFSPPAFFNNNNNNNNNSKHKTLVSGSDARTRFQESLNIFKCLSCESLTSSKFISDDSFPTREKGTPFCDKDKFTYNFGSRLTKSRSISNLVSGEEKYSSHSLWNGERERNIPEHKRFSGISGKSEILTSSPLDKTKKSVSLLNLNKGKRIESLAKSLESVNVESSVADYNKTERSLEYTLPKISRGNECFWTDNVTTTNADVSETSYPKPKLFITLPDVPKYQPTTCIKRATPVTPTNSPTESEFPSVVKKYYTSLPDIPSALPDVPSYNPTSTPVLFDSVTALLDTITVLLDTPSTVHATTDPLSPRISSPFPTSTTSTVVHGIHNTTARTLLSHANPCDVRNEGRKGPTSRSLREMASILELEENIVELKKKKLAELEQEMEKHDRDMLQRIKPPLIQDQQIYGQDLASDIPPPSRYSGKQNTCEVPPFPEPAVPSTTTAIQPMQTLPNVSVNPTQGLPLQEFYTAPSFNKYEGVGTTLNSLSKTVQENTYSESTTMTRSSEAKRLEEEEEEEPPSKSPPQVPPPLPRKSILALSAIPKPKLTDNDSWIMKKKSETNKKDYSKHWLIQEAEQRRLEQQDRISRPGHLPISKTANSFQSTPGYQNHFQNIKSSFHASSTTYNVSPTSPNAVSNGSNASPIIPKKANATFSNGPNSPLHSTNDSSNKHIFNNSSSNVSSNSSNNNNNNNNNNWKKQTKTYQPPQPSPPSGSNKPLPDAIINTITQRVNNKNKINGSNARPTVYSSNNYRADDNYHDYMNTDSFNPAHNNNPVASPVTQGQQGASPLPSGNQQGHVNEDQRLLSVSGKKKCSHCGEELGRGAAMIIESLRLFYHIPCFKCCVCGTQLGNGTSGADVRVRNHKLHCHNCYSNDEGMKFSKV